MTAISSRKRSELTCRRAACLADSSRVGRTSVAFMLAELSMTSTSRRACKLLREEIGLRQREDQQHEPDDLHQ